MPRLWVENDPIMINGRLVATRSLVIICGVCRAEGDERYSLGIFAGYYCNKCWEESGYRKEGRDGFDPLDAGEAYEAEDY